MTRQFFMEQMKNITDDNDDDDDEIKPAPEGIFVPSLKLKLKASFKIGLKS